MIRTTATAVAFAAMLAPLTARADAGWLHASPSLSLASPCNPEASCACTWTLASRMGHILRFTESRYGKRDRNWKLLGVEFTSNDAPQVWYPTFDGISDTIIIQLTRGAATDETRALFQLAHEVTHLLSPGGPGALATVLEEGLATYNSLDYMRAIGDPLEPSYINAPRYERAYRAVRRLSDRPDFASGIERLRASGSFRRVTAADLLRVYPGLPFSEAMLLSETF